jgi:hypothetical protein
MIEKGKPGLILKISRAEKMLSGYIDDFLRTNTRADRDRVIKKREEIKTLKYVINEFL